MLALYFANLHICDEQNAQNCIFTTAKVVNMAIRCKKSANILIYFNTLLIGGIFPGCSDVPIG